MAKVFKNPTQSFQYLLVILIFTVFLLNGSQIRNLKDELSLGERYFNEGSYRLAGEVYDKLLDKITDVQTKSFVLYRIAYCSLALNDYKDAGKRLDELKKINKDKLLGLKADLLKTRILYQMDRYSNRDGILKSLKVIEKALVRFSTDEVRNELIDLYRMKIELLNQYYDNTKLNCTELKADVGKLTELLNDNEQKAALAMWLFTDAYYCKQKLFINPSDSIEYLQQIYENYPGTLSASKAILAVAALYENQMKYNQALDYYDKVISNYSKYNDSLYLAKEAFKRIKDPQAGLYVPMVYKPSDDKKLGLVTRNLKSLDFKVFKIKLEDFFEKIGSVEAIDLYTIPKTTPVVKSWSLKIEEKFDHEIINRQIEADIKENGAYIIEASGKNVTIRSLMIVSDMSLVAKRSSSNDLYWVTDALKGQPVSKAAIYLGTKRKYGKRENLQTQTSIQVTDYSYFSKVSKRTTDDAGILFSESTSGKNSEESFAVAVKGDRYALSQCWSGYYYGWRTGPFIYVQTDRPVYRPAQTVSFKAVMRDYDGKRYNYKTDENVRVTVYDAQNKKIKTLETKTNEFGSINGSFMLEEKPALGQYYLYFEWGGRNTYHYFRVEEYKKPEFIVSVKPAEPQYRLGKPVEAEISADYYFGEPVKGAEVSYKVERQYYYPSYYYYREYGWYYKNSGYDYDNDYRSGYRGKYGYYGSEVVKTGNGVTDESGKLKISFDTDAWKNDNRPDKYYRYTITADVTDKSRRVITGQGTLTVGDKAFLVYLNSEKYLYSPGDKVGIKAVAKTLSEEPVGVSGTMILEKAKYNKDKKDYDFEKKDSTAFEIASKGEALFTVKAPDDGYYRVTFQTADKYDQKITGYAWFWVCSKSFHGTFYKYQGIEIVTDKDEYSPGDTAHLLVNCEVSSNASVLLTFENDILHGYKIVPLEGNSARMDVLIDAAYSPNIWLNACVVSDFKIFSTSREVIVPPKGKFINLSVSAGKKTFKPGEKADFCLEATDETGKPVSTEIALGVVDSSIFYIAPDRSEDIRKFYYGQRKELGVSTATSFDFQSRSVNVITKMGGNLQAGLDYTSDGRRRETVMAEAPSAMAMEKKAAPGKGEEKELAEAKVRTDFRDTGYWNPTIITGENGKAKVTIDIPESLTTWKITARGITKDTRVGNLTDEIVTKKNVIVRLQAPRFFTERDEVTLSSIVHNYLDSAVKAKIYLKTVSLELLDKEAVWKDIQSGGDVRADFKAKATEPGTAKITAYGQTTEESDAMELTFPVIVHGVEKRFARSGKVEEKKTLDFDLPADRKKGASVFEVTISPSIAGVILDSLQYLVDYPYGCVEQTMSRFLPSVAASKALKDMGASNKKLDEKLPKVVKAGLDRLYDFQHSDGGWGWWKDDRSTLYMTSYVYYGLSLAKQAGWDVDSGRLQNAAKYIEGALAEYGQDLNTSAFALHSLSFGGKLGKAAKEQLEYVLRNRQKLNAYSRALIAVTCANVKDKDNAELMLRNLYDYARVNKSTGTISWAEGVSEWWYWYNDSVETTSAALRAYMKTQPKSELIPMIVKWLVDNREGNRWKSTRDTALAVLALTDYLKFSGELNPEYTAKLKIGARTVKEWKITKKDIFDYGKTFVLNDPEIPEGKFDVSIEKDGAGELYYGVSLKYFTKEEDIKGLGSGISIERSYYKVKEKGGTKDIRVPLKSGDTLKSGDEIEVELTVKSDNNYEYVVMEDYKPAGTEPVTLVSGYAWDGGIGYQREMRDEKVVFFVNYLPQGERKLTYRIRAEVPGSFHAMPTVGYAMYAPKIYTLSDEFRLNITD
jgi:uncharacterized protein YfaS (alpha-2-macroglobulin family)